MRLAVEIREKNDASGCGPVKICSALCRRRRAAQRKRALPYLTSLACRSISGPDGPCLRTLFEDRFGRAARSRSSHESDALSIRRPARGRIAASRWREIDDRRQVVCVNTNEPVIAATGNKREPRTIGRPFRRSALAAREKQTLRRARTVRPTEAEVGRCSRAEVGR